MEAAYRLRDAEKVRSRLPHLDTAVSGQPDVRLETAGSVLAPLAGGVDFAELPLRDVLEAASRALLAPLASVFREVLSAWRELLHGPDVVLEPAALATIAEASPLEVIANFVGLLDDFVGLLDDDGADDSSLLVLELAVLAPGAGSPLLELTADLVALRSLVLVLARVAEPALAIAVKLSANRLCLLHVIKKALGAPLAKSMRPVLTDSRQEFFARHNEGLHWSHNVLELAGVPHQAARFVVEHPANFGALRKAVCRDNLPVLVALFLGLHGGGAPRLAPFALLGSGWHVLSRLAIKRRRAWRLAYAFHLFECAEFVRY